MLARLPVSFNKASLQPILRTKIERIPLNWIRLTPPKVIAGFEFSAKSTNLAKMIFVTYMDIIDLRSDCLSIRGSKSINQKQNNLGLLRRAQGNGIAFEVVIPFMSSISMK